jgi:signal transduction histidine kinase
VVALNRQLLAVGRRQTLAVVVDDLRSLVARFQPLLVRAAGDSVRLELETAAASCRASVDPDQLERVVLNLVTNAREAVTENGVVKVKVEPRFWPNRWSTCTGRSRRAAGPPFR